MKIGNKTRNALILRRLLPPPISRTCSFLIPLCRAALLLTLLFPLSSSALLAAPLGTVATVSAPAHWLLLLLALIPLWMVGLWLHDRVRHRIPRRNRFRASR